MMSLLNRKLLIVPLLILGLLVVVSSPVSALFFSDLSGDLLNFSGTSPEVKIDFNKGSSDIRDDGNLWVNTDDTLFLHAPTSVVMWTGAIEFWPNLSNPTIDFKKGDSKIYDNGDLFITTDDYLHLQGTVIAKGLLRPDQDNTYDLGSSTYEWKDLYIDGTGYIDTLNVEGTLTTTGNIVPSANDTYDLGSNTARWKGLYLGADTLHLGTSTSDEYAISYDTTNNRLEFNVNGSGNAEIVLDSSGNVGIGTTNPGAKLDILSDTGMYLGASNDLQLTVSGTDIIFKNATSNGDITFNVNDGGTPTNLLFLDGTNSRVGIGTDSPSKKLHVTDDVYTEDNLYVGSTSETLANTGFALNGDDLFVAGMAGVEGNIYTDGSFITGSTTTYGDGSVTLSSGTNLNIDSGTLFIDNANNRVGIGTTSPTYSLDISGPIRTSNRFYFSDGDTSLERRLIADSNGTVSSYQKISDTQGGFTGTIDGDWFGAHDMISSLGDLDGDGVGDLAVGSRFDDDGGTDRGAVWILFLNTDGTVKSHQKISDTEGNFTGVLDNDYFGISTAFLSDLDGDGVGDLAVGAELDDDGGTDRGAVWILFLNTDGTVKSHQKISDTEGSFTGTLGNSNYFGASLASLGDLDGDGVEDLAVGNERDDDGGTSRGAVWILFLNTDGTVKSHQKISDTEGNFTGTLGNSDMFSYSLSSLGDLDGDGVEDLAVGASKDNDGGADRGAVWILFLNTDGTVKSHQKISDTEGSFTGTLDNMDAFGASLASLGDLDGDGVEDLAVGAPNDGDGGAYSGAVWILFLNTDGTVKSHQKISDTEGSFTGTLDNMDTFGESVDRLGDLNGDGVDDLAVGAPGDDDGNDNNGAIYVLFLNPTTDTSSNLSFLTEGKEGMILTQQGRLGLGIDRPLEKLHLEGNAIFAGGNVGIGTTGPSEKLEVAGNVLVTGGGFIDDGTTLSVPDYVFEVDYSLPTLSELREYVGLSKHLPNMPSMGDTESWAALSLQGRDMKLLEKIEENVLYIFGLDQRISDLEKVLGDDTDIDLEVEGADDLLPKHLESEVSLWAWIKDKFEQFGVLIGENLLKVKELRAEKLCLGETCVTEEELKQLLESREE